MNTIIRTRRKAVSPVIATVILIAVAVALGIAVAFWASGLTSSFSKYEKLGVNTQYATSRGSGWTINLGGQNTGSSDASITQIQVNGVPLTGCTNNDFNFTAASTTNGHFNGLPISVPSGQTFSIAFNLGGSSTCTVASKTFASGQTIQVTIITAAGNNYPASIVLP
ncbi:MAG: archaellin/type IV pilin N-terminal domain-containing protein [Conexivisphaerales archaeon]